LLVGMGPIEETGERVVPRQLGQLLSDTPLLRDVPEEQCERFLARISVHLEPDLHRVQVLLEYHRLLVAKRPGVILMKGATESLGESLPKTLPDADVMAFQ
jgi:hypothetical protein